MLATVVAIVVVDRGGRRMLFFEGGVQMALAEICMAGLIAWNFRAGAAALTSGVRSHILSMQSMLQADLSGLSGQTKPPPGYSLWADTVIFLRHARVHLHRTLRD